MKRQRSLQQKIHLAFVFVFLLGCAAYGTALASRDALTGGRAPAARRPADKGALAPTATPTPVPCITITYTSTPSPTQTATARTHIPPGRAKKTRTPTPHIPPGLAKKTGTPTQHIPPGLAKKTKTPTATPTPDHPVTGSVLIEGGKCCAGGCVGQIITIDVEFSASSPFGVVDEMRVKESWGCVTEQVIETDYWEPFVTLKTYRFTIVPNWVPFYVSVQFRDEHGNLSPVYCDDFHVEGWCTVTGTP